MKQPKLDAFFYQSPLTVLAASILSGSFYSFYWFYKQWKTVGLREGKKPRAFLATLFSEFTSFILFKKVWHAAPLKSVKNRQFYLVPAVAGLVVYIAVTITTILFLHQPVVSILFSLGGIILKSVIFSWVQKIINTTAPKNVRIPKKLHLNSSEIVFLVIGFMYFFANIPVLLFLPSNDTMMRRIDDFQKTTDVLNQQYTILDGSFMKCSTDLDARHAVLDTNNEAAVAVFNKDANACQDIHKQRDEVGGRVLKLSDQLIRSLLEK
jgi:hypothetical protein